MGSSACSSTMPADEGDIQLSTTPSDVRFPNVNQARHCYMRYNEFWRCQAKFGEGAEKCAKMQKFYMSICPAEWVDNWNGQREAGTFPGPVFKSADAPDEH